MKIYYTKNNKNKVEKILKTPKNKQLYNLFLTVLLAIKTMHYIFMQFA